MMLYRLIAPFACFAVRIGERELFDPVRVSEVIHVHGREELQVSR